MKQVAIGRKNWLFLGSVAAGERMADLMTLVSSALRNDLDVWAYVKDVLDQLLAGSTGYASLRERPLGRLSPGAHPCLSDPRTPRSSRRPAFPSRPSPRRQTEPQLTLPPRPLVLLLAHTPAAKTAGG